MSLCHFHSFFGVSASGSTWSTDKNKGGTSGGDFVVDSNLGAVIGKEGAVSIQDMKEELHKQG